VEWIKQERLRKHLKVNQEKKGGGGNSHTEMVGKCREGFRAAECKEVETNVK
jgi:hypothetical protein